jgi:DNA (cytosine-5)-methyltransferase 1
MLTFGSVLAKYRPKWFIWENVPGVLSSHGGRDFAAFLGLVTGQKVEVPPDGKWRRAGAISGIDSAYGIAWRVLDAQFTRTPGFPRAVPQRRQRVWVVGSLGDWRRAGAVLFDSESVLGNFIYKLENSFGSKENLYSFVFQNNQDNIDKYILDFYNTL